MIGKIIIPVVNTEKGIFRANRDLTDEEFENMVYNNFRNNDKAINDYMVEGKRQYRVHGEVVDNDDLTDIDIDYDFKSCECLFLDSKKQEIDESYFDGFKNSGKMSLLIVNINPNEVDPDAETEIKFWVDDSCRILNDETLDDMTKIKVLPKRVFQVEVNNKKYNLDGCKLIDNRSDEKFPFYYIIMIEKTL